MQLKEDQGQFYKLTKGKQTFWNKEKDHFCSEMSLGCPFNSKSLSLKN